MELEHWYILFMKKQEIFWKNINGLYLKVNIVKKNILRNRINWIITGGFFMRIAYMLYTPLAVRSHDLRELSVDSNGHAAYLLNLIEGHLPYTNNFQFYQQPFYYLLSAELAKLLKACIPQVSIYQVVGVSKIVSCLASCLILILVMKLGEVVKLKSTGMEILMLYVAFTPVFYLRGGSVGPDMLATFFITAEFLWTLYWKESPNWKNTFILAISYGLGVMTKISCAIVAVYTVIVFIKRLRKSSSKKETVDLLKKYICFGIVSLPLGLWYSARNYIKFRQPLSYVPDIGRQSELYTGDRSFAERFIYIDLKNLIRSPFCVVEDDYNAPAYFIKSSLFGEFTFGLPLWIPRLLLYCAIGIAVFLALAIIWNAKNYSENYRKDVLLISAIYYASIIVFNMKYPYGCSMDFRYMGFLTVMAGIVMGGYEDQLEERTYGTTVKTLFYGYSFFSVLMYLWIA